MCITTFCSGYIIFSRFSSCQYFWTVYHCASILFVKIKMQYSDYLWDSFISWTFFCDLFAPHPAHYHQHGSRGTSQAFFFLCLWNIFMSFYHQRMHFCVCEQVCLRLLIYSILLCVLWTREWSFFCAHYMCVCVRWDSEWISARAQGLAERTSQTSSLWLWSLGAGQWTLKAADHVHLCLCPFLRMSLFCVHTSEFMCVLTFLSCWKCMLQEQIVDR